MADDKIKNKDHFKNNQKDISESRTATLDTPVYKLKRGMRFANRYEVIEELGRGGMGRVYRVEDTKIKEEVALKVLRPEISVDKDQVERFSNEIKLARRISHKNVCRMYHFGEEKGLYYIIMEYVKGEDLKSTLRRVGPLSAGKAILIAKQIGHGLSEAHSLGIVHRDLKPQNIMIDKQGNVRIMDFGVARFAKGKSITDVGTVIGTPEYMSPEQASAKDVDRRSDLYSLGIVLYEMVTGQTPFSGDTALSVAIKHKTEKPKQPKELNEQIPDELNQLILKCLEKDKQQRYQNVGELLDELKNIEEGIPTTDRVMPKSRPFTSKEITVKFSLKKILLSVSVVLLVGIIAVAVWQFFPRKASEQEPSSNVTIMSEQVSEKVDHFSLGEKLFQEKKLGQALDQFRKVLEEDPSNQEARLKVALILENQGKSEEAVSEYKKALETNPQDPRPYERLASIYEQKNDLNEAVSFYKKSLEVTSPGEEYNRIDRHLKELESRIRAEQVKKEESPPIQVKTEQKSREEKAIPTKKSDDRKEQKSTEAETGTVKKDEEKPAREKDLEAEKKQKQIKQKIKDKVDTGIKEYEKGNYKNSMALMTEVLEIDPENTKAEEYLDLSIQEISKSRIRNMVKSYSDSLQNKTLVSFYEKNCTPVFFPEIKEDAQWIINTYDDLQSFVSDVNIRFTQENRAEAEISLIITGIFKRYGVKQSLFEGVYEWELVKRDNQWMINGVSTQPSTKKKVSKERP